MEDKIILEGTLKSFMTGNPDNAIQFICSGALDFTEYVNIHVSKEEKEGYIEIHPFDLYCGIKIPYIDTILRRRLSESLDYNPHISDRNLKPDLKVYYKCQSFYQHSHHMYRDMINKRDNNIDVTLKEAVDYIKEKKLDIL